MLVVQTYYSFCWMAPDFFREPIVAPQSFCCKVMKVCIQPFRDIAERRSVGTEDAYKRLGSAPATLLMARIIALDFKDVRDNSAMALS